MGSAPEPLKQTGSVDAETLRRRAGDICNRVVAEDRTPTHDELLSVAFLTLAAGTVKPPVRPTSRRVLVPILLLTSSAILVGVLAFEHPARTEVALTATASHIGMTLNGPQLLLGSVDVLEVGVAGCDAMWVPDRDGAGTRHVRDEVLKLQVPPSGPKQGTLTVSDVVAPAGARVRVENSRRPGRLDLSVLARTFTLQIVGAGNADMTLIEGAAPVSFAGTRVIDLQCEAKEWIRLTLTARQPQVELRSPLKVSSIVFEDVDEFVDADRTVISRRATLESAVLTMRSTNGETRTLERGALLRFARVDGEIRRLASQESALAVEFAGDVEGMQTGSLNNPVNLMPSRLQWLRARKTLELTSGAALYLFGMALAVYRWMQPA